MSEMLSPDEMMDNLDESYNYNVLGRNFIDFDSDGDLDIIISIAENTGTGYYLQLLENLGDKIIKGKLKTTKEFKKRQSIKPNKLQNKQ